MERQMKIIILIPMVLIQLGNLIFGTSFSKLGGSQGYCEGFKLGMSENGVVKNPMVYRHVHFPIQMAIWGV